MKILTLNTWNDRGPWQKRWQVITKGIREHAPEIAAFQEVFKKEWALSVQRELGYPVLVFPEERSGLMLLSKYPVLERDCLSMKTQSPTEEYLRYAVFARFSIGRLQLNFFNTHLSWKPEESAVRQKQVEELLAYIEEKAGGDAAAAVGDFNATADSQEIRSFMARGGFQDTYGRLRPGDPGLTWDNRNPFVRQASVVLPDRRIDFVFFRPGLAAPGFPPPVSVTRLYTEPEAENVYASDHYGVLADFGQTPLS